MNLGWFANIIVQHPYIVLSSVLILSVTCFVIPTYLKSMPFPTFQDPQMGFSTRGTSLANRLTTWTNLLKKVGPSGEFSGNPKEYLEIRNKSKSLPQPKPKKKPKHKKNNNKEQPIYGNVYTNPDENSTDLMNEKYRWKMVKDLKHDPRHFNSRLSKHFFCGSPDERYAHLVVTRQDKQDLFTISNMLAMCRLEYELIRLQHYEHLCIQNTHTKACCRPWSMPNYIAFLTRKSSCMAITEDDIVYTKNILSKCSVYFHSMELNLDCLKAPPYCGAPLECIRHDAVFNILNFLTGTSFLPPNSSNANTALTEAMIFLPMACSVAVLPYYHQLETITQEYDGVKVSAMDFGLKSILFDECLLRDAWLMGAGALFIFLCIWLYTHSLFVTLSTLMVIGFSLTISYFMYFIVFKIMFFPFMNLLATLVGVGIGSDDAFIFYKIWELTEREPGISQLMRMTIAFEHAFVSMFVTAVTTAVAFLGSYVSSVTAVSCFSVYAGTAVIVNYVLMMTWFPACLIVWDSFKRSHFTSCVMVGLQRCCFYRPEWNLSATWFQSFKRSWRAKEEFLVDLIIKLKYFWCLFLIGLALIGGVIVFVYPKLELPNTPEFQLFSSSHPFEQYDFYYKDRFWFSKPDKGAEEMSYKLPMRFVWGVLPIDNGDFLNPANLGNLTLDPSFDMSHPESQKWLKNFCENLREQPFYHSTMGPLLPNCFIETFAKSMKRKCYDTVKSRDVTPCCEISEFPFNKTVFDECIIEEMAEIYDTPADLLNSGIAGPKFSKEENPQIKVVIVEYDSTYTYSMSYPEMHNFYTDLETWMAKQLKTAPETMQNGFFISDLSFYDLQRELSESTRTAIIISMGLALVVLFLSTLNAVTSLFAILTVTSSILVALGILVLLGWKLNILESVAISTAIGLTLDFSLHYAVNYKMCPEEIAVNREAATRYALTNMVGPVFMVAMTTGAAGALMLPSLIQPYIQIGSFLLLVMCVSWFYATFLLGSLLAIAGPDKNYGQFHYSGLMSFFKFERVRQRPQMQPSNLPDDHELESLTCTKRDRPTPKHSRRSMSSGGARYTPSKHDQSPSGTSAISIIMADDN